MYPQLAREREVFERVGERNLRDVGARRNGGAPCYHFDLLWFRYSHFARLAGLRELLRAKVRPLARILKVRPLLGKRHFDIRPESPCLYINRHAGFGVMPDGFVAFDLLTRFSTRAHTLRIAFTAHEDTAPAEFEFHRAPADGAGELGGSVAEGGCLRELVLSMHR